jgi:UDP-N-acetylglucosamine--N-acetylmuramyl-(pentapeptide) pyrophosphoryl-undecaprenol N-acetylglucosamine transferase
VSGVHTGNPVRTAVLEHAASPYIPPGDYPMSILVMGGSQGARVMSDIVPPAISALPQEIRRNIRVSHQARPEDIARVKTYYENELITADVQTFFDDVPRRMADAQLVISRSGASTVADVSIVGRPAIWVPYAGAIRNEQEANARQLVEAGAAEIMHEADFEVAPLTKRLTALLSDGPAMMQMAHAALACGVPDATTRLVQMVEELAQTAQN